MDAPATRLLDLPAEMLVMIADLLEREDIRRLRLAHSLLAAAADDAFGRLFSTTSQILTMERLGRLADLTVKPNWARKMKKVEFCSLNVDPKKLGLEHGSAKHGTRSAARREEALEYLVEESRNYDNMEDCLAGVFENLSEIDADVDVTLTRPYSEAVLFQHSGVRQLIDRHQIRAKDLTFEGSSKEVMSSTDDAAFLVIMKALVDGCYHPRNLDLLMCELNMSTFETLIEEREGAAESWSRLGMLELGVRWTAEASALESFFDEIEDLHVLALNLKESPRTPLSQDRNSVRWLSSATSHLCLVSLTLMDAKTTSADLIAFINSHCLFSITLCMVHLPADECWSSIFRALKDKCPQLDYLCFDGVTIGFGDHVKMFVDTSSDEEELEVNGEESVAQKLGFLATFPGYVDLSWL